MTNRFTVSLRALMTRPLPYLLLALTAFSGAAYAGVSDTAQTGPNFSVTIGLGGVLFDDVDDGVCGVTHCTLREAINAANSDPDNSIITFDSTAFAVARTITIGSALPTFATGYEITINGSTAGVTVNASANTFDVFTVSSPSIATFRSLTISGGNNGISSPNPASVAVYNCTFATNQIGISGGAIAVHNSTFSGNGKGISSDNATVVNCTISGNTLGVENLGAATNFVGRNTLLVGNTTNYTGTLTGGSDLLIGTAVDAGLDPAGLQNNGGPTKTIALLSSSTAINAGNNAFAGDIMNSGAPLTTDQRGAGFRRIRGNPVTVDIGAYEFAQNTNPVATDVTLTGNKNASFTGQLTATDADTSDTLTYSIVTGTLPAGLTLNSNGSITGTPTVSANGTTVTFKANDGTADSNTATATFNIGEVPSLVVNTTSDSGTNLDGLTSLREAITFANSNPDASTITFDPTVFATLQGISVTGQLPALTTNITITGPTAGVRVHGSFVVNSTGTATLNGIKIYSGSVGITNNSGTVTATNCDLEESSITNNSGTVTLTNCTITIYNGSTSGIANTSGTVTATNCTILNISADPASGVTNTSGTVTLTNCEITATTTGISNDDASAVVTVTNCNIFGGRFASGIKSQGTVTAVNCTILCDVFGFQNDASGTMSITNCTIAPASNSTGIANNGSTVTIKNTICTGHVTANTTGTITDDGSNITTGTIAAAGLEVDGDGAPVLKNNGGPLRTIALQSGGTAINAGLNANVPGGITSDQRGTSFLRIVGGTVDIGAFEFNDASAAVAFTTPTPYSFFPSSGGGALTTTTGTASDTDGIASVVVHLYRQAVGGNSAGYWNGTSFDATYNLATHQLAATVTGTTSATWSLALPTLGQGGYALVATAKDTNGNYKAAGVSFTVNDVPPTLSISAPANNSTLTSVPSSATGTAGNVTGVRCYGLYRYNTGGNTVGWWDGNSLTTPVFATTNSNSATLPAATTANSFADWSLTLPTLGAGKYQLFIQQYRRQKFLGEMDV